MQYATTGIVDFLDSAAYRSPGKSLLVGALMILRQWLGTTSKRAGRVTSVRILGACILLAGFFAGTTGSTYARAQKPMIAVFSGPTATIQNSEPLVTSNKARQKYGLPLLNDPDGTRAVFDSPFAPNAWPHRLRCTSKSSVHIL